MDLHARIRECHCDCEPEGAINKPTILSDFAGGPSKIAIGTADCQRALPSRGGRYHHCVYDFLRYPDHHCVNGFLRYPDHHCVNGFLRYSDHPTLHHRLWRSNLLCDRLAGKQNSNHAYHELNVHSKFFLSRVRTPESTYLTDVRRS